MIYQLKYGTFFIFYLLIINLISSAKHQLFILKTCALFIKFLKALGIDKSSLIGEV